MVHWLLDLVHCFLVFSFNPTHLLLFWFTRFRYYFYFSEHTSFWSSVFPYKDDTLENRIQEVMRHFVYFTEKRFSWTKSTRKDLAFCPTPVPWRKRSSPHARMSSDSRLPGGGKDTFETDCAPVASQHCLWPLLVVYSLTQSCFSGYILSPNWDCTGLNMFKGREQKTPTEPGLVFKNNTFHVYTKLHLVEVFSHVSLQWL